MFVEKLTLGGGREKEGKKKIGLESSARKLNKTKALNGAPAQAVRSSTQKGGRAVQLLVQLSSLAQLYQRQHM